MAAISPLQKARASYQPKLPAVLEENGPFVSLREGEATRSVADQEEIARVFPDTYGLPVVTFGPGTQRDTEPLRVGVILSGGQAPGGHNVIAGLFDGLKAFHSDSELLGFLGGPRGLMKDRSRLLTEEVVDAYRNTGGFDMIQSGRDKIETAEDFAAVEATCVRHGIDALVVIGGDDSNTNACLLAQYLIRRGSKVQVIGCPKTIDGDLKNDQIEVSFGFDTATKVYAELIGNIERDANSAQKYWHFIKLMGRSASHIALECALQTHPNWCVISEEVAARGLTLRAIATELANRIRERADRGMNFGVALIPEGLIEFIPEVNALIQELNDLLSEKSALGAYFGSLAGDDDRLQFVNSKLSSASSQAFSSLPMAIQLQLLGDRDAHGNVQVSKIETEKLLIDLVSDILREWKATGQYQGKFSAQAHFFGYEGRCAAPSNFDADYCYSLGYTAAALIGSGRTGYLSNVRNLCAPAREWEAGGVPLAMMMNIERRHGQSKPVIRKALVDLDGKPFQRFAAGREVWGSGTEYLYPGPIQYFGPGEVCDRPSLTLLLERG
ncbi:MAG: diphosphate--fructose-6-phosphate 1-phosphotransferase [Lentisphaeria bacterium]|nr:diphosphate--fructose-6-phosphate 1-phosphotransferase [Lentisphaeria bacterium]